MIPAGYQYKKVELKPEWLKTDAVFDIYSQSSCISEDFANYISFWKHNGYWLFNSPQVIEDIAREKVIDLSGTTLFYYVAYEFEFDEDTKEWTLFSPESSFITDIKKPIQKQLEGFDVVTFSGHNSPECSPLSCNSLAETIPVNSHCLFNTFAEAKQALEEGLFENSEPGPFRIFAVYTVNYDLTGHERLCGPNP